jgi:DNA-binding transcriptional ArsR family regulator
MIQELGQRPTSLNQLAERLGVDHRTITHHAGVLTPNSLVVSQRERYGAVYFLSRRLESGLPIFRETVERLRFKLE